MEENKLNNTDNKLIDTDNKLSGADNKLNNTDNKLIDTENKLIDTENKILDKTTSDTFIKFLKTQSANKQCADCKRHSPVWVSISFGIFLCSDCASKHRSMGVNVSKVKSTLLDTWTVNELRRLSVSGNTLIHELGEIEDIRLKYLNNSKYKIKIDRLVKESEIKQPGLSFMDQGIKKGNVIVNEVKAVPIPKFRDSEFCDDSKINRESNEKGDKKVGEKKSTVKKNLDKQNIFLIKKKDTPSITKSDKNYEIDDTPNNRLGFKMNKK